MFHMKLKRILKAATCSKYFARRTPPPPPTPAHTHRSTGINSTFTEHGHVAYQINRNIEMQQHGSNCFAARLPSPTTLGDWGQKVKIQLFQNMVMLDIEYIVITKCSNMVANILPTDPPPTYPSGQKVKIYLFQNMVTLHINVFGITKCNKTCSNILPADPPFP